MSLPADDMVKAGGLTGLSLPALAARAQLGDRSALEELLKRLQPQLVAHISGIVRDDDVAADVLQDTMFIICRRLGTIRDTDWVRAWAYRVSTREAYRSLRRSSHLQEQAIEHMDDLQDLSGGESGIDDAELLAQLPAKLGALPAAAQIVLRMHYLQSLTQHEVAEALEIPLGTVKSRIAYGLACLRRAWAS